MTARHADLPDDHFEGLVRLAAEKGWIEDGQRAIADMEELRLAREGARRHLAHYRMVVGVMAYRWLGRIGRCLRTSLRQKLSDGLLRVKPHPFAQCRPPI
jgi:hypothetical protein